MLVSNSYSCCLIVVFRLCTMNLLNRHIEYNSSQRRVIDGCHNLINDVIINLIEGNE